jgi:hypothetical protein
MPCAFRSIAAAQSSNSPLLLSGTGYVCAPHLTSRQQNGALALVGCRHSASVSATSYRPNTSGRVEFKPGPWVVERVMASDPRRVEVVVLSRPEGASDGAGGDMHSDPNFLGFASFKLAQVWELLAAEKQQYECRLQLKLEPRTQCTGSVIVRITVEKEDYNAGVQYRR